MNPARLVTFAMYFAIAYLVIKMFISSKRNGKNKMIIDAVRLIPCLEVSTINLQEHIFDKIIQVQY